jgi:hypothetical protein
MNASVESVALGMVLVQVAGPVFRDAAAVGMRRAAAVMVMARWVTAPESGALGMAVLRVAGPGSRGIAAVGVERVVPVDGHVAVPSATRGIALESVALGMAAKVRVARSASRDAADVRRAAAAGRVALLLLASRRAVPPSQHACSPWPGGALPSLAHADAPLHAMREWSERE